MFRMCFLLSAVCWGITANQVVERCRLSAAAAAFLVVLRRAAVREAEATVAVIRAPGLVQARHTSPASTQRMDSPATMITWLS